MTQTITFLICYGDNDTNHVVPGRVHGDQERAWCAADPVGATSAGLSAPCGHAPPSGRPEAFFALVFNRWQVTAGAGPPSVRTIGNAHCGELKNCPKVSPLLFLSWQLETC